MVSPSKGTESAPRPADPPAPRRAPPGFRVVSAGLLSGLKELPCDVHIATGGHAILYTTIGSEAAEVVRRMDGEGDILIRAEDEDLFRRFLAAGLRGVLADTSRPPAEKSRRAYAITTEVVRPLFAAVASIDRDGLAITHEAIDAVTERLTDGDDLVWAIVATMQKHLTTHTHAVNTAIYAGVLAQYLHITKREELLDIGRGALLHDIGKTRISERILDKPGPLTRPEWKVIQGHPATGLQLVTRALGVVPGYGHIIAEHHERADGSGYPGGRRSNRVAIDSQLVAIVDAFDALTSDRSYKKASTPFDALRTMRFEMAGQFNDELLQEFIGLLGGWKELRRGELQALGAATTNVAVA